MLQKSRLVYRPLYPKALQDLRELSLRPLPSKFRLTDAIKKVFPKTGDLPAWRIEKGKGKSNRKMNVGVIFSGGQAAGGHNVISGLYDGLSQFHMNSQILGFLDGPSGLIDNKYRQITASLIDSFRNVGGFDMIGSGRTKIETDEQFQKAAKTAREHQLDAIIVIGGDDSNTNAALLAEYFLHNELPTRVIGVPKTIDGDLRCEDIEISFGFDSACKTYSEMIGNIGRDALSAKKYYHFIKLMGRSASHITLECALQTHPNISIIGEEGQSLSQVVSSIADLISERKEIGKEYGIVLLPEGLIEFIPEFKSLIQSLNHLIANQKTPNELEEPHRSFFASIPEKFQQQLLMERDSHGNVQVSQIETEQLILSLVKQEMKKRAIQFNPLHHFFGYEGRSCFPTNFDANYCYSLGLFAALCVREEATGVILAMKNMKRSPQEWEPRAVPIVRLIGFELRSGKQKPVIAKTLVDLHGRAYHYYCQKKVKWRLDDRFVSPGPIQFFGDSELTDSIPISLNI